MKLLFIFNPIAGKEKIKNRLGEIIELFCYQGHDVTVRTTMGPGDATRYVKEMDDSFERVVCAGGDGTLDEVVKGMYERERKVPIGYLPAGSTNDFAVSMGIPIQIPKAAEAAISDELFACDLGLFNNKTFVYVAAFGAFTEVSYGTPQATKNMLGHAAYVLEALKRIGGIKNYRMKVKADDFEVEEDFIFGMITNSKSVGGIKNITGTDIDMQDGLFEVTLVKAPRNPADINLIITGLMNRANPTDLIYSFKASEIDFESEADVPWTLDGEFGGDERNVKVLNLKQAFEIAVK